MTEIQPMTPGHWDQVRTIYEQGMAGGNATFETIAPSWEKWDSSHAAACRLVAIEHGRVVGWAALLPVSARPVYSGVAELSIYIDNAAQGRGIGSRLLQQLISESEAQGYWTLQAGVFPENIASIRLHERFGFRKIGYRERIGRMGSVWRDTVLLERRSAIVGTAPNEL